MRGYLCSFWARHGATQKTKEQAEASGSPAVGGWIFQSAGRPARQAVRRSVAGGFARASRDYAFQAREHDMNASTKAFVGAAAAAAAMILAGAPAGAATYYVSPTGDNSADGGPDSPWATISHAITTNQIGRA